MILDALIRDLQIKLGALEGKLNAMGASVRAIESTTGNNTITIASAVALIAAIDDRLKIVEDIVTTTTTTTTSTTTTTTTTL